MHYGHFGQTSIIPPGVDPSGSGMTTTGVTMGGSTGPTGSGLTSTGVPGGGLATMLTVPLPTNASWAFAPIVKNIMVSADAGLFTMPLGQEEAWYEMAVRWLLSSGSFDPGQTALAQQNIYALSQAYGYFSLPGDLNFQVIWQGLRAQSMADWLSHAMGAAYLYQQLAPSVLGKPISAAGLARVLAIAKSEQAAAAAAAAPPAAAGTNTLTLVAIAGVLGIGAYLALA